MCRSIKTKASNRKITTRIKLSLFFICFSLFPISVFSQDIPAYRILNITFDTYQPGQLKLNNGRLIWKDINPDSGTYNLRYYSGAEIFKLDSGLFGLTSAIDGDYIAWNTSAEEIKIFNTRDWTTQLIGSSYNPDYKQPISIANGKIAFSRATGNGSEIVVRDLISGEEKTFSEGVWNLEPSINHGQLVWVQKFQADTFRSNIYFYDGQSARMLTTTGSFKNVHPIVKDGQVVWLQSYGNVEGVFLFDGDSVLNLGETVAGSIISGFDLSNGIAISAVTDTVTNDTEIRIYNSETGSLTFINDTARISGLHIDNGLIAWSSGTNALKNLMLYNLNTGLLEEWGSARNPVVDDGQIAWTLGDAVSMMVPVANAQLSSGNDNGWPQSRFKDNNGSSVIWGNLDSSTNARLFYSDGNSTVQLTDSIIYKDFITTNDGYTVWRHDFTNLYLYDGSSEPELIVDSLQCENMYLADGLIGFHGFRSDAGNNINQAWLYNIATTDLIQLSSDDSEDITNTFTLVDGGYACWFRDSSTVTMLMLYDGSSKTRLTEFPVDNQFSFVNGKIVWSESINNVYQIMLYDVNSHIKTQITNSISDSYRPVTDGSKIVWFESNPSVLLMWYYDIATGKAHKVANFNPIAARWLWLSNGRVAWSSAGEVCVYDGNVISRLTSSAPFNPNSEPYVDQEVVVWNKNNPDPNINHYGQVFRAKLHAHVDFDAENITGNAPLTVAFFNNSFQGARSNHWDFGDGQTSTEKNPVHIYQNPGVYSVILTVDGLTGLTSEKKINLVRARQKPTSIGTSSELSGKNLLQVYPNPFSSSTTISWEIPANDFVTLKIYNMLGVEVASLVNDIQPDGKHEIIFDAGHLNNGIYMILLNVRSYIEHKFIILNK